MNECQVWRNHLLRQGALFFPLPSDWKESLNYVDLMRLFHFGQKYLDGMPHLMHFVIKFLKHMK